MLDLCDRALAVSDAERDVFLARACEGDSRLRASVDSVLIAIGKAGSFLNTNENDRIGESDLVGRRVGSFELVESLGEGGMGSVYLAERREEGYEQRVAIKFIHGHMLAKELVERFNAERQILAALNHPYIAALIDSGTTDEGVPFIVMEFIDGIPIDEYCDKHKFGIEARIRLIQKVAMAVQAAHQNLIVHRDLKPSNVLVTPDGIPKLLDFGIAKLIQPLESDERGNTTIFGHQAMTPDYASPEQILENKVTTASDVYTLGVLTYQLLVGERPYRIQTSSHRDMVKSVEGLTVPKPSTRLDSISSADTRQSIARQRATSIEKLRRILQGDIDNILLMALRQEPDRRYGSVAQFSDDLNCYLRGLPVSAHADTFGYRTRKFLKRNWLPMGAASLVAVSLAGGIVATTIQAGEAARQQGIAETQAGNAQRTLSFLKDVLFVGDPFRSGESEQSVEDILKYAEENLDQEYSGDLASKALILTALSEIYAARADYERSQALSASAVALYEGDLGVETNDAANAYRVNALSYYFQDDYATAGSQFEIALGIYDRIADPDWSGLTRAYDQMAMAQSYLVGESVAIEYYNRALTTYRDHDLDDSEQLISILGNLGVEHLQIGDYRLADSILVEAIETARKSQASNPRIAWLLSNHAGVLKNLDRHNEATAHYVEAADVLTSSVGLNHPETITTLTSLANHYRQLGEMALAAQTIRTAVDAAQAGLPEIDFITSYVHNVAGAILCLGDDIELGTELANKSLAARRQLLPEGHWAVHSGEGIVGSCLTAAGNYETAEDVLVQAYSALQIALGEDHEVTIATRERLHQLYIAWNKPADAERYSTPQD